MLRYNSMMCNELASGTGKKHQAADVACIWNITVGLKPFGDVTKGQEKERERRACEIS